MFINFINGFTLDQTTENKTKNYLLEFSTYLASQIKETIWPERKYSKDLLVTIYTEIMTSEIILSSSEEISLPLNNTNGLWKY